MGRKLPQLSLLPPPYQCKETIVPPTQESPAQCQVPSKCSINVSFQWGCSAAKPLWSTDLWLFFSNLQLLYFLKSLCGRCFSFMELNDGISREPALPLGAGRPGGPWDRAHLTSQWWRSRGAHHASRGPPDDASASLLLSDFTLCRPRNSPRIVPPRPNRLPLHFYH